jgi:hypothetical protein
VKYSGNPQGPPQSGARAVSGGKRSRVPRTAFNVWLISDTLGNLQLDVQGVNKNNFFGLSRSHFVTGQILLVGLVPIEGQSMTAQKCS